MRPTHAPGWLVLGFFLVLFLPLLAAGGCGDSQTTTTLATTSGSGETSNPTPGEQTFTLEQLAKFDGKDGRPAYVAVDGIVYDVSTSLSWQEGTHSRCNLGASAGRDLSELIKQAPASMRGLLARMPVVGKLVE